MDYSEVTAIGKTTGIIVMRDKDIQNREARWRTRKLFRNSVQKIQKRERNKRNIESCAIKRALQLQSDGKICFSPVSEKIEASYHYPHARKISNLILFSTKGGKKDHK
jgi:hypothetical protein